MKIEVLPGAIRVNSIHVVREADGIVVLHADLKAKYAQINAISDGQVHLVAGDPTMYAEKSPPRQMTSIAVDAFPDQTIDAVLNRYTLTIFAYRRPTEKDCKLLWP